MRALLTPLLPVVLLAACISAGCSRTGVAPPSAPIFQEPRHRAPHGGTVIALGDDAYHIELVRDAEGSTLQAYLLDDDLENFVRSTSTSMTIAVTFEGATRTLVLAAVPSPVTGESIGDSSLFQGQAPWIKSTPQFDGVIAEITLRGSTFSNVRFSFPKGNG